MFKLNIISKTKVATPVNNLQEFIQLRNSRSNLDNLAKARQGDDRAKRALVQFNYSCLPNEDGTLKGAKRLSHFVGMDVDFDKSAPDYEEKMANAPALILSKKDELQLMMLERSATKGYHIVFRRHSDLTQEQNLRWASDLLGIEYDKGAKDCTRVFFATSASKDDLIFIDEAIFDNSECVVSSTSTDDAVPKKKQAKERKATNGGKATKAKGAKKNDSADVKAEERSLKAFDCCVELAQLDPNSLDKWGEHNWHSNLLAILSAGLPKLLSYEQAMAVIKVRLPKYAKYPDAENLVKSFYNDYKTQNSYMSKGIREINAKLDSNNANGTMERNAAYYSFLRTPMPKKLPRIIELCISNYDPRYREMLALSCLPILAVHASGFQAKFDSNKVVGCMTNVVVVGESGSGKSTMTDLYHDMTDKTLRVDDRVEMQKVRANVEERDAKKNKKDCPGKYHPKLHTFETVSKTSLLDLMSNLGPNGMLLGVFSEADAFSSGYKQGYSDLSVYVRKGWDGDDLSQYYQSESSCNAYTPIRLSLLMSGTPKAIFDRLMYDSENGMLQRFIIVTTPMATNSLRPPKQYLLTDDEVMERDSLLLKLYNKNKDLGDDFQTLDLTPVNDAIVSWFKELESLLQEGKLTTAEGTLSRRCSQFAFRAAIPLVALYGKVTKEIVDFALWVGRTAFHNICVLFGENVAKEQKIGQKYLKNIQFDARVSALPLLDRLPNIFSTKDFNALYQENGSTSSGGNRLNAFCKKGYIVKIKRGYYKKLI